MSFEAACGVDCAEREPLYGGNDLIHGDSHTTAIQNNVNAQS